MQTQNHPAPPARKGPTARVAATAALVLLLLAAPVQAMVMTYQPLLAIYGTGGGGGTPTEPDPPAWLTTQPGRSVMAPVEGGTDLTYGYDDVVLRSWASAGTSQQQRVVEDNIARVDIDGTVATSLQAEMEEGVVTNPLHNKFAAQLSLTPGHGWFLHLDRAPTQPVAVTTGWMGSEMDLDQEDVLIETTYDCTRWDGSKKTGGYPFNLRAEASGFVHDDILRLDWSVEGTGLDRVASTNPQQNAQRNDHLLVTININDPNDEFSTCSTTARFVIDLLVVHEWYEPATATVCTYTLGSFSTDSYHYTSEIALAFARHSGTGATNEWDGESQDVSVLYFPILHQQLAVHLLPDSESEAIQQITDSATGNVRRLGTQAGNDGDVMYVLGQTGIIGGKLSGIYHQSGGPSKSDCFQATESMAYGY